MSENKENIATKESWIEEKRIDAILKSVYKKRRN
jgi:hypothetical protein